MVYVPHFNKGTSGAEAPISYQPGFGGSGTPPAASTGEATTASWRLAADI